MRNKVKLKPEFLVWAALVALPFLAILIALGSGRLNLSLIDVLEVLLDSDSHSDIAPIVWFVRMPRTLTSLLVGAALALAGGVLQGLLRNPLAGPQTVGVTSGAALGGAFAISIGLSGLAMLSISFVAGFATVMAVIALARFVDHTSQAGLSILTVVLAGIVLSSLAAAGTTLIQHSADPEEILPQIVYWLMGSFAAVDQGDIVLILVMLFPMGLLLWGYGLRLDLLNGGEDEAKALGMNIRRDTSIMLVIVAALGAVSVAVAGVVGWVGLVIPHAARLVVGPSHRKMLPAAALLGGSFLCLVDTAARSLTPVELPVSALTSLIGAPVFVILMLTHARRLRDA